MIQKYFYCCGNFAQIRILRMRKCGGDFYDANAMRMRRLSNIIMRKKEKAPKTRKWRSRNMSGKQKKSFLFYNWLLWSEKINNCKNSLRCKVPSMYSKALKFPVSMRITICAGWFQNRSLTRRYTASDISNICAWKLVAKIKPLLKPIFDWKGAAKNSAISWFLNLKFPLASRTVGIFSTNSLGEFL